MINSNANNNLINRVFIPITFIINILVNIFFDSYFILRTYIIINIIILLKSINYSKIYD